MLAMLVLARVLAVSPVLGVAQAVALPVPVAM
jgi:hypothetical protein